MSLFFFFFNTASQFLDIVAICYFETHEALWNYSSKYIEHISSQ